MRNLVKVSLIAGSLAFGGLLYAQEGGGDKQEKKADTAEVDVSGEKKAELSPLEMQKKTDELIGAMREGLKEVIKVQKIARKQQDVIKLNCVNDKLLQVKQLLNIAEGANTDMQEAIEQVNENERYHQYGKVVIGAEQVSGLVEEAKNCIGEELIYIGPLTIDVDRPDIDDPDQNPFPEVDIEPPAYASPFG